jgi:hypothetical protein
MAASDSASGTPRQFPNRMVNPLPILPCSPPGVSRIKRASGGFDRAFLRADATICPGQDGTGSHPGRQCVCLAKPVPFRALNPHGSLGRQRFQAHHPQRRGRGLRFLDLTLPLTIGAGPHQSRPNPEARVCEKADPPLHAQGPDHLDRSTAIVLTLNGPCRRPPRPARR